jgi:hypothetical protein
MSELISSVVRRGRSELKYGSRSNLEARTCCLGEWIFGSEANSFAEI